MLNNIDSRMDPWATPLIISTNILFFFDDTVFNYVINLRQISTGHKNQIKRRTTKGLGKVH